MVVRWDRFWDVVRPRLWFYGGGRASASEHLTRAARGVRPEPLAAACWAPSMARAPVPGSALRLRARDGV